MEVILLEKMRNLGVLGDKVKVKAGYARNYLVPQGKAVYATKDNLAKFELRRAELEKRAQERAQAGIARQAKINALPAITFTVKASDEGKMFGSITTRDIAAELEKMGAEIEKREIQLAEGVIRNVGEYDIVIEIDSDITATIRVNIVAGA